MFGKHEFADFPSENDRRQFADVAEELREMIILLPHDQAFYLMNEALQWVISNTDESDIAELYGMIEMFQNEATNDFENISSHKLRGLLKSLIINIINKLARGSL